MDECDMSDSLLSDSLLSDSLLTRDQTAAALTKAGYPITRATLATKATRGGGPPYQPWGRKPLYRWGDALAWAQSLTSAPRRSTSEGDLQSRRIPSFEEVLKRPDSSRGSRRRGTFLFTVPPRSDFQ